MKTTTATTNIADSSVKARRQIIYELISGGTGLALALFMWGHIVLVGSILTGARGFDWMATMLEDYFIAQPTVAAIFTIFIVHAIFASRKIPAQLRERRRMIELAKGLSRSGRENVPTRRDNSPFVPHLDSMLWIWQVRTGMVMLVIGSFHLILLGIDVFTPLFGEYAGIESTTSMARVAAGLWLPYAVLLICVEFHASVGLYRLAIKWGSDVLPHRRVLHRIEQVIFWLILGIGALTLFVLAGWVQPPLEFLLSEVSP